MATIQLNIPDAQLQRVIEALCARPFIMQAPTPLPEPGVEPEVSGALAKKIVVEWVKANVVAYEAEKARQAAPIDVDTLVS